MSTSIYFRQTFLLILLLTSSYVFAQTNAEKIKAKWSVEKFVVENDTPQAIKAQQELLGACLEFENEELVISKKTATIDSVIKRGQYLVSGNKLILGKDQADILLLSEKSLTINISGQGVLYLLKM